MAELTQGEIADKLSILELKEGAGLSVSDEIDDLVKHWNGPPELLTEMRQVNKLAWEVVEDLNGFFYGTYDKDDALEDFRWAHALNRRRVTLKNRINRLVGETTEKKTWNSFTT